MPEEKGKKVTSLYLANSSALSVQHILMSCANTEHASIRASLHAEMLKLLAREGSKN